MSAQQITDIAVEAISLSELTAADLRRIAADEGGYLAYRLVPIGRDGCRESEGAQMIWDESGRAGIACETGASWTEAATPRDAAEQFFGVVARLIPTDGDYH